MLKKSLMFFSVVFLAGILILGCSSPTGPAGKDGEPGTPSTGNNGNNSGSTGQTGGGTTTLNDELSTASLQKMIDDYSTIIISGSGLTQLDAGVIFISSQKELILDGDLTLDSDGILMLESADSLSGSGEFKTGTVVADESIDGNIDDATLVPLYAKGDLAKYEDLAAFGVLGDTKVGATSSADIDIGDLSEDSLEIYVIGKLTVSGDLSGKTSIAFTATDNVTINDAAEFEGAVTSAKDITASVVDAITGDVTARGKVTFTAAQAAIGALTAGSLEATALTTSGPVGITGATTITGAFEPGANVTFNGLTSITGEVAPTTNIELAGTGFVTLGAIDTTAGTIAFKNTHANGVRLNAPSTALATGNLVATAGVAIKGGTNGVTVGGANLAVGASASVDVSSGSIVAGTGGNTVTITKATLGEGTYAGAAAALTLTTKGEIVVADDGEVAILGTGVINLSEALTKIILTANGRLRAAIGGDILDTDHASVKLTVGTTLLPNTPAKALVASTGTPLVWTVTEDTGGDTGSAGNPIVGKIRWVIDGTSAVDAAVGSDADGNGGDAIGTLKAGTGTTITITGT
jgi:hypothetical protein